MTQSRRRTGCLNGAGPYDRSPGSRRIGGCPRVLGKLRGNSPAPPISSRLPARGLRIGTPGAHPAPRSSVYTFLSLSSRSISSPSVKNGRGPAAWHRVRDRRRRNRAALPACAPRCRTRRVARSWDLFLQPAANQSVEPIRSLEKIGRHNRQKHPSRSCAHAQRRADSVTVLASKGTSCSSTFASTSSALPSESKPITTLLRNGRAASSAKRLPALPPAIAEG